MGLLRGCAQPFILTLFTFILILLSVSAYPGPKITKTQWLNHGGDLHNRRFAAQETIISPKTARKLRLKWRFDAERDITATPVIYKGILYFPSWDGNVYAVKESDGSLVWKKSLQQLTGFDATGVVMDVDTVVARASPTIAGDLVIIGLYSPAVVLALKRESGDLVWMTTLEDHPLSLITMSGSYYKGEFYVGVSSLEELVDITECCTFRGSFAKLDIRTGKILWQTYMVPDNQGKLGEYAGAAVWGSSPSIDVQRNLVFIATGNLYTAPQRVQSCQEREKNQTVPKHPDQCVEPDVHSESILALDLDTGMIKWFRQLGGYDFQFSACNDLSIANCPVGLNPDSDFGEAPMLLSMYMNRTKRDLAVAVQKTGFAWALDRDNGQIVWVTEAGPGGLSGGGTWGAATDEKRIYTNIANSNRKVFTLHPSNRTTTAGGWVGMDSSTGKILWSTANPSNASSNGPVSVANGVVFAGSVDGRGPIYAMDAKTGAILWSYNTGATVYGGMSISNGCIFVGNGYKVNVAGIVNPANTAGKSLFAFCVPNV